STSTVLCSVRHSLDVRLPRPPSAPLFPYTTLFRSRSNEGSRRFSAAATVGAAAAAAAAIAAAAAAAAGKAVAPATTTAAAAQMRSEEHTSELQSRFDLVCRLLLEKKNQSVNPSL